jgi:hypothetical protein
VLFVLLFYIVHCCIDIEDRSLSGLYFNKIILFYLNNTFYISLITLLSHASYRKYHWGINCVSVIFLKYVSSKPMISCKSRRFLSKAPKTGHVPIDKIMYRGYYACTYENTYTILVYWRISFMIMCVKYPRLSYVGRKKDWISRTSELCEDPCVMVIALAH